MNNKETTIINKENTIKKSNEISTARLFYGLSLNQMQLFAYAIYVTQQNSETRFNKADFEKKFEIEQYHTKQAKQDSRALMALSVELPVEGKDSFKFRSVFQGIDYEKGLFTFTWSEYMKPHILELKNKFIETDLSIAMKFKSSFSWTLYDLLKASYGRYYLDFSKEGLMTVFSVDKVKSYQNNTSLFKKNVLDLAIKEVNKHTEFTVSYDELKKGRAIKGFKIKMFKGQMTNKATSNQLAYLNDLSEVSKNEAWLEIVKINTESQRKLATSVLETILRLCNQIDKSLSYERADSLIKQINEKIRFIQQIVAEEKVKTSIEDINDPYKNLEIPIYDIFKR